MLEKLYRAMFFTGPKVPLSNPKRMYRKPICRIIKNRVVMIGA
jgi:hypothetical protein